MEWGENDLAVLRSQVREALPAALPAPRLATEELENIYKLKFVEVVRTALREAQGRIQTKIDEFVASTKRMLQDAQRARSQSASPLLPSSDSIKKKQTDLYQLLMSIDSLAKKRKADISALQVKVPERLTALQASIDATEAFASQAKDEIASRFMALKLSVSNITSTNFTLTVSNQKFYKLSGVKVKITSTGGGVYDESLEVVPGSGTVQTLITPNGLPNDSPLTVQARIDSDIVSNSLSITLPRQAV